MAGYEPVLQVKGGNVAAFFAPNAALKTIRL
jgi:hypothetical protein